MSGSREESVCRFHSYIHCADHRCERCGWAPKEAVRRRSRLREEGIHALEPRKKNKGRPVQVSDEEAKDFIRKNCRAYGGEMPMEKILRAIHTNAPRYYRLRREIDEELDAVGQ